MAVIDVRGDIIPNDTKWIYDWLEWDSTCPNDIRNALAEKEEGEQRAWSESCLYCVCSWGLS